MMGDKKRPVIPAPQEKTGGGPHQLFLTKTFQIFSREDFREYCEWNDAGNAIVIKKIPEFSKTVLPQYFKHGKFSSFVRQLYAYGFYKSSSRGDSQTEFQHPYFLRDRPDLFARIKLRGSSLKRARTQSAQDNKPKNSLSLEKVREELNGFATWKRQLTLQLESLGQSQIAVNQDQSMVRKTLEIRRNVEAELNKKIQQSLQLMDAIYSKTMEAGSSDNRKLEGPTSRAAIEGPSSIKSNTLSSPLSNQSTSSEMAMQAKLAQDLALTAAVSSGVPTLQATQQSQVATPSMQCPSSGSVSGTMMDASSANLMSVLGMWNTGLTQTQPQAGGAGGTAPGVATGGAPQVAELAALGHQAQQGWSSQGPSALVHLPTAQQLQSSPQLQQLQHTTVAQISKLPQLLAAHHQMVGATGAPFTVQQPIALQAGILPQAYLLNNIQASQLAVLQQQQQQQQQPGGAAIPVGNPVPQQPQHQQTAMLSGANKPVGERQQQQQQSAPDVEDFHGFSKQIDFIQEQLLDLYNTEGGTSASEWSETLPF